jgi:GAF domain-containing protein
MSSSKKIDNRLNKLFDEIKHTEEDAETEPATKPVAVKRPPAPPRREPPHREPPPSPKPPRSEPPQTSEPPKRSIHTRSLSPAMLEAHEKRMAGGTSTPGNLVAIPFQTGESWSMIQLQQDARREWNEDEQSLVRQVADQLGLALNNARLLQETQKRAQQMSSVAEIATRISSILELQTLLQTSVHLTQQRFELYHAHLFMKQDDNRTLSVRACGWKGAETFEETTDVDHIDIDIEAPVSIVARAARTKKAVISNDVHGDTGWLPNRLLPDIQSEMAIPVISGEQVLGVLNVHSDELNHFTDADLAIMTTLAAQIGSAIQNAVLFSETQRYATEMALLNAVVTEAASTLDLRKSLTGIIAQMAKALSLSNADVTLLDSHGMLNVVAELHGTQDDNSQNIGPVPVDPLLKSAVETGEPVTLRNAQQLNLSPALKRSIDLYNTQTVMVIPLLAQDRTFGLASLHISQEGREFNRDEMRLATTILTQVSIVVQNAQLFEQTRARARREQLLREITARVRSSTDPDAILQTAVREIGQAFGVKSFIRVGNAEDLGKASSATNQDAAITAPTEPVSKDDGDAADRQPEKAEGDK